MAPGLNIRGVYLGESVSIEEGCQYDSLLISVPVEFTAFILEFWISSDIGHHDVLISDCSLVHHGWPLWPHLDLRAEG